MPISEDVAEILAALGGPPVDLTNVEALLQELIGWINASGYPPGEVGGNPLNTPTIYYYLSFLMVIEQRLDLLQIAVAAIKTNSDAIKAAIGAQTTTADDLQSLLVSTNALLTQIRDNTAP